MKIKINDYKFQKISSVMSKDFGKIKKGNEEDFSFNLFSMESNMLKVNRKNKYCNGIRATEAIHICLFNIHGRLNNIDYDLDEYINDENKALVYALSMAYDPFVNEQLRTVISEEYDLSVASELQDFFTTPVKCLLRIEDSIELWSKRYGSNGYFKFIEDQFGSSVSNDDKMDFTVSKREG